MERGTSVKNAGADVRAIQLLFRKVQNAFVAKLVKHCALTKINSVTVGTE
jgi:hypothetical protein